MVILNEVKFAENILYLDGINNKRENLFGSKPSQVITILARYYKQVKKMSDKDIYAALDDLLFRNYPGYNRVSWEDMLWSCAKKSAKFPLHEINGIGITEKEMNMIHSLNNIDCEKVAFTLLCYAKFYNTLNSANNGWTNVGLIELFKVAKVSNKKDYNNRLIINDIKGFHKIETVDEDTGEIFEQDWITLSLITENTNIRVNFIDDSTDYVLIVDDFRELGLEYMKYISIDNTYYKRCKYCGILFKDTTKKNNMLYCNKHNKVINNQQKVFKCIDCGNDYLASAKTTVSKRCDYCNRIYRLKYMSDMQKRKKI